ncbi:MAG: hypothetical protein DMD96_13090 [Candidatus Rokuibacteriota bacterium]|nr:MAG: hypothetical protein DMD96_13090 [Candidatus Rokubacteria bacterium]
MSRLLAPALLALMILPSLVTPALAQAPAPKVTITGLFDQVTAGGRNFYDGNFSRDGDREWYARTRFRPDIQFAVGRTKAVLGLEIDIMYGQAGASDGGFPGNNSGSGGGNAAVGGGPGGTKANTNGAFDLNTDVGGMIEIKWMYTEFDLTGKDSLLPFIPVQTVARAGAQPFASLSNYKIAAYSNGDFAGVSAVTTFDPSVKTNLAYIIVEDQLAGSNRGIPNQRFTRGEDWAVIFSPEVTPFKGLDIKPLYSYFHADGVTSSSARRNLQNIRTVGQTTNGPGAYCNTSALTPSVTGFTPATTNAAGALVSTPGACANAGDPTYHDDRHTVGLDARWRSGPFGFDPTVYYQWGTHTSQAQKTNGTIGRVDADMSAWFFDAVGSFQLGPLLLEARGIYTTGNEARDNLAKSIRYYQPLDADGSYYTGWAQILSTGVDYFNGGFLPFSRWIGYDRYGRASLGLRATYSFTPAFSVYGIVSPTWTATKVDTDTGVVAASATANNGNGSLTRTTVVGSNQSWVKGDSNYIGTEANLGLTWRFAPNTAFDLVGAWLFAGDALNTAELLNGVTVRREANDGYQLAARVRLAF